MALESFLKEYFELVIENGKEFAACTQVSCSFKASKVPNKTSGNSYFHTGNLTGHLKRRHTSQFDSLQAKRIQETSSETAQKGINSFLIHKTAAIPKRIHVEFELSKEEVEMAAIEPVTINSLPLSVFEKSGISKLLSPMLDKLGLTLNRSNIRDLVIHQANVLREQIAEEVTGKLISLKFDIASRKERGFL